jgi:hypothetical protein
MLSTNKNQADNKILAASKNQADCKILVANEKQADCKIFAASESQPDGKILAGVEIPALVKYQRSWSWQNWKSRRPAYCLGSVESPTADFSLVPLLSTFSS